jgi:hypothetical protein
MPKIKPIETALQKNIGNELLDYISKGQSLSQAIVNTSLSNKLSKQLPAPPVCSKITIT